MILLDTDVLIEILDKNSKKGDEALIRIDDLGGEVVITSINLHELLFGLYKYSKDKNIEKVLRLKTHGFGKEDAELSSKIEAESEKKGAKVARFDSMIAAVAINRGLSLYTFNEKHYEGINGLNLLK